MVRRKKQFGPLTMHKYIIKTLKYQGLDPAAMRELVIAEAHTRYANWIGKFKQLNILYNTAVTPVLKRENVPPGMYGLYRSCFLKAYVAVEERRDVWEVLDYCERVMGVRANLVEEMLRNAGKELPPRPPTPQAPKA